MKLRPMALSVSLSLATVLAACSPSTQPAAGDAASQAPQADKAARHNQLYADYWEGVLKLNPLQATFQGDNRYNDQLPDFYSAAFRKQNHDFTARWLKKIESVGSAGLTGQARISYDIFVHAMYSDGPQDARSGLREMETHMLNGIRPGGAPR